MKFNAEKMAFGRHETFALRYGWLSKGFQNIVANKNIFESDEATVQLGVGKNMVSAIKYWLRACQMIHPSENTPTDLGTKILSKDGFDPYLEDEATIWLLHWLLATNAELSTAWFWFFNRFHKPEFTSQELITALSDFVSEQIINKKKPALATLKSDALLIPRMYTQSKGNTRTPLEDALDSPFALLKLISQSAGGRNFQSRPSARPELPIGVLGFAVTKTFESRSAVAIPIEDFMYSRDAFPAIGSVFRLSESDLISKLEGLVDYVPGYYEIRDTAGQHQLFRLADADALIFVEKYYERIDEELAA